MFRRGKKKERKKEEKNETPRRNSTSKDAAVEKSFSQDLKRQLCAETIGMNGSLILIYSTMKQIKRRAKVKNKKKIKIKMAEIEIQQTSLEPVHLI
jgi:hypothetical protein